MQDANGTANHREAQSNDGRCEMWQEANQQQFTPRLFTYSSIRISHQPYPNEIASNVGIFSFQRIIKSFHNSPDHISSHEISIHWITIFIHNYGKSPFLTGKSTISMAIFNSYVSLPEGKIPSSILIFWTSFFVRERALPFDRFQLVKMPTWVPTRRWALSASEAASHDLCWSGSPENVKTNTIWLFNIAMKISYKWRFLDGKIIYFYGPSIPWLC